MEVLQLLLEIENILVGLLGQTAQHGIVISSIQDIHKIDFSRPSMLYSQTTQNISEYQEVIAKIQEKYDALNRSEYFSYAHTICHSVIHRAQQIQQFAAHFEKVIFVSGEKSSNGLYLFDICKKTNPHTFFMAELLFVEPYSSLYVLLGYLLLFHIPFLRKKGYNKNIYAV